MIDYNDRDSIYNAIKFAQGDNPKTLALAQDIRRALERAAEQRQGRTVAKDVQDALDRLDIDSDDVTIRAGARALMIDKLKSKEITAPEFAQFAKVFNLDSAKDSLSVESVDFAAVIADCPACGANVYAPDPLDQ